MTPAKGARFHFTLCAIAAILSITYLAAAADSVQPAAANIQRLAPQLASTLSRFTIEKSNLVELIAKDRSLTVPRQVREFFAAAQKDDWMATSNRFISLLS